jgi:hypothetical protein
MQSYQVMADQRCLHMAMQRAMIVDESKLTI